MAQDDDSRPDLEAQLEAAKKEIGAEALAALLRLSPETRAALLDLPAATPSRPKRVTRGKVGRKKGSGVDAEPALARMEALLLTNIGLSEREAAERVVREGIVHLSAVRLRTLYRERKPARLVQLRREALEARDAAQELAKAPIQAILLYRDEIEAAFRKMIEQAKGPQARQIASLVQQQRESAARLAQEMSRAMWAPGGVLYEAAQAVRNSSSQTRELLQSFNDATVRKYLRALLEESQRLRPALLPGSEPPDNS